MSTSIYFKLKDLSKSQPTHSKKIERLIVHYSNAYTGAVNQLALYLPNPLDGVLGQYYANVMYSDSSTTRQKATKYYSFYKCIVTLLKFSHIPKSYATSFYLENLKELKGLILEDLKKINSSVLEDLEQINSVMLEDLKGLMVDDLKELNSVMVEDLKEINSYMLKELEGMKGLKVEDLKELNSLMLKDLEQINSYMLEDLNGINF